MLHREIIAVVPEIYSKHTNRLCGQNGVLTSVKPGGKDKVKVHPITGHEGPKVE
jgi:hypothetical protein